MFGGSSNAGAMSDLWRYHIATNEWTWMGGPTTGGADGVYGVLYQESYDFVPSGRFEANTAWTDLNNNLWLFGGYFERYNNSGDLNDIWRYNIANGKWAWMGGSQQIDAPGNYGALGVESATNIPSGRNTYTHWANGKYLYFAGGENTTSNTFTMTFGNLM